MDSKTAGLTNRPLQAFAKNQIWLELACLAYELLAWTQLLAFYDPARPNLRTQTPPTAGPC